MKAVFEEDQRCRNQVRHKISGLVEVVVLYPFQCLGLLSQVPAMCSFNINLSLTMYSACSPCHIWVPLTYKKFYLKFGACTYYSYLSLLRSRETSLITFPWDKSLKKLFLYCGQDPNRLIKMCTNFSNEESFQYTTFVIDKTWKLEHVSIHPLTFCN